MATDLSAVVLKVLGQVHPDAEINSAARGVVENFIVPVNTYFLTHPNNQDIDAYIRKYIPGELAKHSISELYKQINNPTRGGLTPGSAVIEYLLAEILELSGNTARDHNIRGNEYVITIYDIYTAIVADEELRRIFPVPQFPFRVTFRERIPANNLAAKFNSSGHLGLDFTEGLNDYLDTFIANVRKMNDQHVNAVLVQAGIPVDPNPITNQNKYIGLIFSRINNSIQTYLQSVGSRELNFTDLISILGNL